MQEQENAIYDVKNTEDIITEAFAATRRMQQGMDFPLTLQADWLDTPLGTMLVAGNDEHVHLVCFIEKASLVRKAAILQKGLKAWLELGESASVTAAKRELAEYFAGRRRKFETPVKSVGTAFQERVWDELRTVPFGETVSYVDLAKTIGRPAAFRAVAQANAQNPAAVLMPCHRIVNGDGSIGGYNAGIERKRWLLDFEKGILGHGETTP